MSKKAMSATGQFITNLAQALQEALDLLAQGQTGSPVILETAWACFDHGKQQAYWSSLAYRNGSWQHLAPRLRQFTRNKVEWNYHNVAYAGELIARYPVGNTIDKLFLVAVGNSFKALWKMPFKRLNQNGHDLVIMMLPGDNRLELPDPGNRLYPPRKL